MATGRLGLAAAVAVEDAQRGGAGEREAGVGADELDEVEQGDVQLGVWGVVVVGVVVFFVGRWRRWWGGGRGG